MRDLTVYILVVVALLIYAHARQSTRSTLEILEENQVPLAILNLTSDKPLYYSRELLNLTLIVYSSSEKSGVNATVNGIKGRLNQEGSLNLTKGLNEVSFYYTLPRCNVCGGINEGEYNISTQLKHENTVLDESIIIGIYQEKK